ncbi:hypothetical protein D3C72_1209390 [compost metagenome]
MTISRSFPIRNRPHSSKGRTATEMNVIASFFFIFMSFIIRIKNMVDPPLQSAATRKMPLLYKRGIA